MPSVNISETRAVTGQRSPVTVQTQSRGMRSNPRDDKSGGEHHELWFQPGDRELSIRPTHSTDHGEILILPSTRSMVYARRMRGENGIGNGVASA
ncbi:hypothetical protein J6590_023586 [Homalodisca vitripennis]|nr:hypothetical protein J6590_023586 [Homalodisca vitripennis]